MQVQYSCILSLPCPVCLIPIYVHSYVLYPFISPVLVAAGAIVQSHTASTSSTSSSTTTNSTLASLIRSRSALGVTGTVSYVPGQNDRLAQAGAWSIAQLQGDASTTLALVQVASFDERLSISLNASAVAPLVTYQQCAPGHVYAVGAAAFAVAAGASAGACWPCPARTFRAASMQACAACAADQLCPLATAAPIGTAASPALVQVQPIATLLSTALNQSLPTGAILHFGAHGDVPALSAGSLRSPGDLYSLQRAYGFALLGLSVLLLLLFVGAILVPGPDECTDCKRFLRHSDIFSTEHPVGFGQGALPWRISLISKYVP